MGWDGRDWINVAQDRDKWQVVVNMIKKGVPKNKRNMFTS
jgi:hypothetical protein